MIERVSIELTQRCAKACSFCYSRSHPRGGTTFEPGEVIAFARDLAEHGVRALSLGGGEPLEYDGVFDVLAALSGSLFRSVTTSGLPLCDEAVVCALVRAAPDKVHVSIHLPDRASEVARVIDQVDMLSALGIKSGVNLLVRRSGLEAARAALDALRAAGIGLDRVVLLPMRRADTPSAREVAEIAGAPFQSMTCLSGCAKSPRFCAIAWDKTVAWCSYTEERAPLESLTHHAVVRALANRGVTFCGGAGELLSLSARPDTR